MLLRAILFIVGISATEGLVPQPQYNVKATDDSVIAGKKTVLANMDAVALPEQTRHFTAPIKDAIKKVEKMGLKDEKKITKVMMEDFRKLLDKRWITIQAMIEEAKEILYGVGDDPHKRAMRTLGHQAASFAQVNHLEALKMYDSQFKQVENITLAEIKELESMQKKWRAIADKWATDVASHKKENSAAFMEAFNNTKTILTAENKQAENDAQGVIATEKKSMLEVVNALQQLTAETEVMTQEMSDDAKATSKKMAALKTENSTKLVDTAKLREDTLSANRMDIKKQAEIVVEAKNQDTANKELAEMQSDLKTKNAELQVQQKNFKTTHDSRIADGKVRKATSDGLELQKQEALELVAERRDELAKAKTAKAEATQRIKEFEADLVAKAEAEAKKQAADMVTQQAKLKDQQKASEDVVAATAASDQADKDLQTAKEKLAAAKAAAAAAEKKAKEKGIKDMDTLAEAKIQVTKAGTLDYANSGLKSKITDQKQVNALLSSKEEVAKKKKVTSMALLEQLKKAVASLPVTNMNKASFFVADHEDDSYNGGYFEAGPWAGNIPTADRNMAYKNAQGRFMYRFINKSGLSRFWLLDERDQSGADVLEPQANGGLKESDSSPLPPMGAFNKGATISAPPVSRK